MTADTRIPTIRVDRPGELIETIPYLLGFHPVSSLVLIGLRAGSVLVTTRADLADLHEPDDLVRHTTSLIGRGGGDEVIAVIYRPGTHAEGAPLPDWALAERVAQSARATGLAVLDLLLVCGERWWSYLCDDEVCCPSVGNAVLGDTSTAAATATYAGLVARPSRADVEATITPIDAKLREALEPCLAEHEYLAVQAALRGQTSRHQRAVKRAIFAAARDCDATLFPGPRGLCADDTLCRFAVGLLETTTRDAIWLAVDHGRLDGRALWRHLATHLPEPYSAPALLLFGWASWRAGDVMLARIAAERALVSDATYTAAELLLAAIDAGMNPRHVPKLRPSRSSPADSRWRTSNQRKSA